MGILGNFSRINFGCVRYAGGGALALTRGNLSTNRPGLWRNRLARNGSTDALHGEAMPTGYYPQAAWRMPITAGEMSMQWTGTGALTADLYPSKNMTIDLTGSGDLTAIGALVVSMLCALSGSGALTADIVGRLNASIDMTGSGDMTADISAFGEMLAALEGSGDLDATIAAFGDMEIDIVVTGTGLSTSNVGQAVWAALAASNNVAGTMGEKLNDAGSASNPWTEVIESGFTAAEILKILAAVLAGKVSGAGTGTETFTGLDGATERVVSVNDSSGNRTDVTLDGS